MYKSKAVMKLLLPWFTLSMVGTSMDALAGPSDSDKDGSLSIMKQGPWSKGISREHKAAADELFKDGNKLLIDDSEEAKAADKYRAAAEDWPHPAVYFNLSVALRDLDQPIERYRALRKAIEYGAAPLNPEIYERALRDKKQVEKEVVEVEVRCDTQDARVTMNGNQLFTGPGSIKVLLRVGRHNFSAIKKGYLSTTKTRAFTPGPQRPMVLYMFRESDLKVPYSRWAKWKPWAVAGGALALVGVGVGVNYLSNQNFAAYDQLVEENCPSGCAGGEFTEYEDRAKLQRGISIGMYITAGVVFTASVALVYANRTRIEEISVEEAEKRITVAPVITGKSAGLAASVKF